MTLPRVTLDPETAYAYVYLTEPTRGIAETSVTLEDLAESEEIDALHALVLDFDADGRLVGIEVATRAETVLRPDVLASAEELGS